MTRSLLQIGLRTLTFCTAVVALVTVLWISQLDAVDPYVSEVKAATQRNPVSFTVYTMQGCGHCTHFKTELAEFSSQHPDVVIEIVEIYPGSNAPKHRNNAQRAQLAGIQGFPTTHVLVKGQKKMTLVGMRRATELNQVVEGLQQDGSPASVSPEPIL